MTLNGEKVLWDRRRDGGFPESKQLKQIIRDNIAPTKGLGHSDVSEKVSVPSDCAECNESDQEAPQNAQNETNIIQSQTFSSGANVRIAYCTGCRWLLRSSWMMQELLTSFEEELESVTLIPSIPPAPGGVFVSERINVHLKHNPKDRTQQIHYFLENHRRLKLRSRPFGTE